MTLVFKHKSGSGQHYSAHFFTFFSTYINSFLIPISYLISEQLRNFERQPTHCPVDKIHHLCENPQGASDRRNGTFLVHLLIQI